MKSKEPHKICIVSHKALHEALRVVGQHMGIKIDESQIKQHSHEVLEAIEKHVKTAKFSVTGLHGYDITSKIKADIENKKMLNSYFDEITPVTLRGDTYVFYDLVLKTLSGGKKVDSPIHNLLECLALADKYTKEENREVVLIVMPEEQTVVKDLLADLGVEIKFQLSSAPNNDNQIIA